LAVKWTKNRFVAPTVVTNVRADEPLMREEIFGPILPVLAVESLAEAVRFVNARDKPLSLYVFSKDKSTIDKIINQTSSGNVCVNDVVMQVACPDMPFGGVGASGTGAYNGRWSFEEFSHRRTVLEKGTFLDPSIRYPPYTPSKIASFERAANLKLPANLPSLKQIGAVAAGLGLFALRAKM